VAAVVIARRQDPIETSRNPLEYRSSLSRGIRSRGVEVDSRFRPIELLDRLTEPPFEASPEDLEIEKALRGNYRG
jgi:hypothetical protein